MQVEGGDRLRLETPGGGGYGPPSGTADPRATTTAKKRQRLGAGAEEFSVPVRDSGSVLQYTRNQETV